MERLPFALPEDDQLEPDGSGVFVRVAVERGLDTGGLTYREGDEPLAIGDRVEVPLGRGNAPTGGLVVEIGSMDLLGGFDPKKVKRVSKRVGPVLPASMVALAQWISRFYLTPLGMVIGAMVPTAVKQSVGVRKIQCIDLVDDESRPTPLPKLTPSAKRAWKAILELPTADFPMIPQRLATAANASNLGPINRLVEAGLLQQVEIEEIRRFGPANQTLLDDESALPPQLTEDQRRVVEGIDTARSTREFGVHLLRGVTGSGKTEVYIHLIERALESGRGAIVLVPEIALTPQTAGRFVNRLANAGVEVLHSGLSASARNQSWSRLASGVSRVVVGARSAVFAPMDRPAITIVDEEHDSSYKQDQLPRYNARDVAIKRAQLDGGHVVLGSATPSLESWWNAHTKTHHGTPRSSLWELPHRVAGRMPEVKIVGPRERIAETSNAQSEPKKRDGWIGIGPVLGDAMEQTFADGGQVMLLLNRRGFASYVACSQQSCGWSLGCESCDARMVVHRAGLKPGQHAPRGYVRCHHCLAEQVIPRTCPNCQKTIILFGLGIQRVETELLDRFGLEADQDFARLDSDSVRRAADYFSILDRFAKGDLRMLLGTQMIAKGLDFPNVRLVGVINADTSLAQPDFRAAERTFQLVSQVAGRAGRGEHPGKVIIQTMHPHEPAIVLASRHDYATFAKHELSLRHSNGLPPCTRMARIVCRDRDAQKAEGDASEIAKALRATQIRDVRVDGPMPCVLTRIADHFRFGVEIVAPDASTLLQLLTTLRSAGLLKSDARTAVDVDPVSLM